MLRTSPNRRSFLSALGSVPFIGSILPAAARPARGSSQARDVIGDLGVTPIINAAGTYTKFTASLMPAEVVEAIRESSAKYVRLDELHLAAGKRIAELLKCEAALVSAGCASALSLATAACVAGKDPGKIIRIPDTHGMKNEVIIQKTHRNGYDHAVRNAGTQLIEVETTQELERAVNHRTAMLFFLNNAGKKGQIEWEEFVELGKKHNIPTLIDAAADVPPVDNLFRFTKMGFDLVAFSGGKGIRGPQSAGLLLGRKDLIEAAVMNNSPNSNSLCRSNKVNKEEIVGMVAALELYLNRDHKADWNEWERRCGQIAKEVKKVNTVKTEMFVPELANMVPHLRVMWNHTKLGVTPEQVHERMSVGEPNIELRPGAEEDITVGVWMMQDGDDKSVGRRLREELQRG